MSIKRIKIWITLQTKENAEWYYDLLLNCLVLLRTTSLWIKIAVIKFFYKFWHQYFLVFAYTTYLVYTFYIIIFANTNVPIWYGRNICVIVGYFKFSFSNPLRTTAPEKDLVERQGLFQRNKSLRDLWNALRAWNTPSACEMTAGVSGLISFHFLL